MAAYAPRTWVNGSSPYLSATNLNAMEAGIVAALAGACNVKDYGAAGDDSADDTAEIQAALNAGAGSVVVFPEGVYKISDELTVSAGTTITGRGTIHQATAGASGLTFTGSGVTIEGISVRGTRATPAFNGSEYAIKGVGASAASPMTDIMIRDVTIMEWGNAGVSLKWATRWHVLDSYIHTIGLSGVEILSGFDGVIRGNRIATIGPGSSGDMYCVILTQGVENPTVNDPATERVIVDGNHLYGSAWHGINTHSGMNLVISNNTIYNCARAIWLTGAAYTTISGNLIDYIGTLPSDPRSMYIASGNAVVITGNTIRNHGSLFLAATGGSVVTGNAFFQCSPSSIYMEGNNESFTVTGNTFTDMWHATSGTYAIDASSGTGNETGVIVGNSCRRGDMSDPGQINDCFLRIWGTGNSVQVGYNDVTAMVAALDVPAGSVKEGFFGLLDPVAKPTGVAVSAAGVHAALVTLGLISA